MLKATWHPQCSGTYSFTTAFDHFKNFFFDKTFIAWDKRLDGLPPKAKFGRAVAKYIPPDFPPFGEVHSVPEVPRVIKIMRGRNKGKGKEVEVEGLGGGSRSVRDRRGKGKGVAVDESVGEVNNDQRPKKRKRKEVCVQQHGEGSKQASKNPPIAQQNKIKKQLLERISNAFEDPNPAVLRDTLCGQDVALDQSYEGNNHAEERTLLDEQKEAEKNQLLGKSGKALDDPDALKSALWEEWMKAFTMEG